MIGNFLFNLLNKFTPESDLIVREVNNKRRGGFFLRPIFVVSVTTRCNFHCPHCIREFTDDNKTLIRDLAPDVFETVLREGRKINFTNVSFTGGEPILSPYFPQLVEIVKKYNYAYNFASNGWLYQDYWPIIQNSRQNFELIFLSADGATAEVHDAVRNKPGSFKRLVEAIKFYREKKIYLILVFCITKKNYHQIEDIADFALKNGVRAVKYAAAVGLNKSNNFVLSSEEKFRVFKKIAQIQEKFKDKIKFTMTANLAGEFSRHQLHSPDFCTVLNGKHLFIDHDGGMLFCCDLYKKCAAKPLISELGFAECLKINFDVMNEIKKRHAHNLLNNSLSQLVNFCDFCNNYVEELFYNYNKN